MDRQTCKRIAEASEKALRDVAERFGVDVKYKSGNYSDHSAALRFEFTEAGAPSREAEAFQRHAHIYGLKADDLGAEFKINGNAYRITGLNGRARKMPIQATRISDGRGYKFSEEIVGLALARTRTRSRLGSDRS